MDIEAKIEDLVCIRLGDIDNVILADEVNKQNNPLVPGVMFDGNHYGFVLITDVNRRQKEVYYPTQNRIDVIGIEEGEFGDLNIFENEKYHPWFFFYDGKFKQKASYNPYSRRDKVFVQDVYGLNMEDAVDCFSLIIKK